MVSSSFCGRVVRVHVMPDGVTERAKCTPGIIVDIHDDETVDLKVFGQFGEAGYELQNATYGTVFDYHG